MTTFDRMRAFARFVAFCAAGAPLAAGAAGTAPLPAPAVLSVPHTFAADPSWNVRAHAGAPAPETAPMPQGEYTSEIHSFADRYRAEMQSRTERYELDRTMQKKFGYGKKVTLRARRY